VVRTDLKTIADVVHDYRVAANAAARLELLKGMAKQLSFAVSVKTDGTDPKQARLLGLAFSFAPHKGWFVPVPRAADETAAL